MANYLLLFCKACWPYSVISRFMGSGAPVLELGRKQLIRMYARRRDIVFSSKYS